MSNGNPTVVPTPQPVNAAVSSAFQADFDTFLTTASAEELAAARRDMRNVEYGRMSGRQKAAYWAKRAAPAACTGILAGAAGLWAGKRAARPVSVAPAVDNVLHIQPAMDAANEQ